MRASLLHLLFTPKKFTLLDFGFFQVASRFYSCPDQLQEEYTKSLLASIGIKCKKKKAENSQNWEIIAVQQNSVSEIRQPKKPSRTLRQLQRPVRHKESSAVASPVFKSANLVKAVASLSEEYPCTPIESDVEPIVPISSLINPSQTLKESLDQTKAWFCQLNLDALRPSIQHSFNLATFVPRSVTLSQLVRLGVDLSKVEAIPAMADMLVKMDFKSDIEPKIWKLSDRGFSLTQIARLITLYPKVLQLSLEDIDLRLDYFEDHNFSQTDIAAMISKNPLILSLHSLELDRHLGQIQELFDYTDSQLRACAVLIPQIITHPLSKIKDVYVLLSKMMGFSKSSIKSVTCETPKLLVAERERLIENFSLMCLRLELPSDAVERWAACLICAPLLLLQRATFLARRKLLQLDPTKPLYTPLNLVVEGTDEEFCEKFGRCSVVDYDTFVKTL